MDGSSTSGDRSNVVGGFFYATLLLWLGSVWYYILFNNRVDLLFVIAGSLFYQAANWVIRLVFSRDPLFVNTSVSLLHSTTTSASGSFFSFIFRKFSHFGGKLQYFCKLIQQIFAIYQVVVRLPNNFTRLCM